MSTLDDLAKAIDDVVAHRIDVLTDGDWFNELVEKKVNKEIADKSDLLYALEVAERFMCGFEDDEMQEGIDEKLALIREAIIRAK